MNRRILFLMLTFISFDSALASGLRCEEQVCVIAEQAVRDILKDPGSADFRKDFVCYARMKGIDRVIVIGEVNAKNSFGGMTGYQSYAWEASAGAHLISDVPFSQICEKFQSD